MTNARTHTRMLTLVFTDLVGSTGMKVAQGDGAAAVLFALELQHGLEPDVPPVHIGLHLGEVLSHTDGAVPPVEGLAVDVCARVQSLATGGQILASAAVAASAKAHVGDERQRAGTVAFSTEGPFLQALGMETVIFDRAGASTRRIPGARPHQAGGRRAGPADR